MKRHQRIRRVSEKKACQLAEQPFRRMSTMPETNAERRAKRKREKARKYARFRRSEGRRAALERAAGRCEMQLLDGSRCPATEHLSVHHKTYARFGGAELPTDLVVLCKGHHEAVEQTKYRYRHTNRRAVA